MNNHFRVDQESIIYGRLKSASSLSLKEIKKQIYTNKKAILLLSDVDSTNSDLAVDDQLINQQYRLLTQEMFSVARLQLNGEHATANLIHFAMSYHGIEYEWSEWMAKFEVLLKSMYWQSVVVHLETEFSGVHTFKWESVNASHVPGEDDFNVRCEWDHEVSFTD